MNFTTTQLLSTLQIREHGGRVWVVGGAIRDELLGRQSEDIDFCTDLDLPTLWNVLKDHAIILPDQTAMEHGICRVIDSSTGKIIDIACLREDAVCDGRHAKVVFTKDLQKDLARRDFTINAMAREVNEDGTLGELIDPFNGRQDLQDKLIRFVGDPDTRIREDALRMIRACRFRALGPEWGIVDSTAIRIAHRDILNVSKERIRDEIMKALTYPNPSYFFIATEATGLLSLFWPDLSAAVGVGQNAHHAEPVFDHLLRCLDASVALTDKPMLRLAALTHDIGKPATRTEDETGVHFYKHEVVGASMIYNWMKEYKFTNLQTEYVSKMVRHHQWRFEDKTKPKTIRHWLNEVGKDHWRDLVTLRAADRAGNLKKMRDGKSIITAKMRELCEIAEQMISSGAPIFKEDLAINGDDIKALGVKPGPQYKEIFSNLLGIVLNDPEKNNKEWLTEYVQKHYVRRTND